MNSFIILNGTPMPIKTWTCIKEIATLLKNPSENYGDILYNLERKLDWSNLRNLIKYLRSHNLGNEEAELYRYLSAGLFIGEVWCDEEAEMLKSHMNDPVDNMFKYAKWRFSSGDLDKADGFIHVCHRWSNQETGNIPDEFVLALTYSWETFIWFISNKDGNKEE